MSKTLNQIIGERIRHERKAQNVTRAELANKIGKSLNTVQKYEKGEIDISLTVIEKITGVLNVGLSSFFYELPTSNKEKYINDLLPLLRIGRQRQRESEKTMYSLMKRLELIGLDINRITELTIQGQSPFELTETLIVKFPENETEFIRFISKAYDKAEKRKAELIPLKNK